MTYVDFYLDASIRKAAFPTADIRIIDLEGRQKPHEQMLLPCALPNFANIVELIQMSSQCGMGLCTSNLHEEMNTALSLQKLSLTPDNDVSLPEVFRHAIC